MNLFYLSYLSSILEPLSERIYDVQLTNEQNGQSDGFRTFFNKKY